MVRVNLETGVLMATLDGYVETTDIIGLGNGDVAYGVSSDLQSVVSVGGATCINYNTLYNLLLRQKNALP